MRTTPHVNPWWTPLSYEKKWVFYYSVRFHLVLLGKPGPCPGRECVPASWCTGRTGTGPGTLCYQLPFPDPPGVEGACPSGGSCYSHPCCPCPLRIPALYSSLHFRTIQVLNYIWLFKIGPRFFFNKLTCRLSEISR